MANEFKMLLVQVKVILFMILLNGQPVNLSIMYSYGEIDSVLPPNDDGSSIEIPILTTFPYFDKNYNSLYVNTNGAISFERALNEYTPRRFPLDNNRILIAPFWADVDIRRQGKVFYREVLNPESDAFKNATNAIKNAFPKIKEGFTPLWVFVATWSKVPFYGHAASNQSQHITNTFQLVLVTNGRHSFVIFNYEEIQWTSGKASGGNSSGLGGTEAECGFNAGDGVNYFSITRFNYSTLLALPFNSNIKRPGVWIFKIDNAVIERGGCNTKGFLTFRAGNVDSMHGGTNIRVAGPCFNSKDIVLCKFGTEPATPGSIGVNGFSNEVWCTVPMVNHTKRVTLKLSLDNGESFPFSGQFQYVGVDETVPMRGSTKIGTQDLFKKNTEWKESVKVQIDWKARWTFGNELVKVKIQIARYILENNIARFLSFYDLRNQSNTGESQFVILKHEGKGIRGYTAVSGRFVSFIRVIKESLYKTTRESTNEWIWSDAIVWDTKEDRQANCKAWYKTQPDPRLITERNDLLACPPTREKALKDIGRYQSHSKKSTVSNPKAECVQTIIPSNRSTGQECCYNSNGNLIIEPPYSGKLIRVHKKSGIIPYISYYFHDVLPYQDCCLPISEDPKNINCRLFYKKRPADNGEKYEPPRPAVTVGDPHIITLDGVEYTFNGIGEFHVLKVISNGFTLQGRMEQMLPVNNTKINATVYTAFAMTETGSDIIQINLNGRGFVEIFVNAENVDFNREELFEFSNGFILKSSNVSTYSVIFNSGICVTVEGYTDLLQSLIIVPEKFKGSTSGLFGFWDDDKEKEFLLPNGNFLNTTLSPETIHYDFGLEWATKNNESLFFYPYGKSHSSFYKPEFVPAFLDYRNLTFEDQNLEREARRICGDSTQCLIDIKLTGKKSIGLSSRKSLEEFKEILKVSKKKDCIPIDPVLESGVTQRNDSEEGNLVYYFRCNSHYVLNGSDVIMCNHGIWNGTKPRCVECVLEDPNIIAQVIEETSHDMTYQVHCKAGYKKNGPDSLKCMRGKWITSQPKCIKHTKPKKEEISAFHIGLISAGCALFLVIMMIITSSLVKRRMNTRNAVIKGRKSKEHPLGSHNGVFGEENNVMMLSFSNLKDSSASEPKSIETTGIDDQHKGLNISSG